MLELRGRLGGAMKLSAHAILIAGSLLLGVCAQAQTCADNHPSDNLTRAGANGYCMAIQTFTPKLAGSNAPLIVLIHGDCQGTMLDRAYPALAQRLAQRFAVPVVYMLRPGYRSDFGVSDGYASLVDDDYTKANVDYMSYAIASLRKFYGDKKVVIVGHSGGAAMGALLNSRYPSLV